MDEIPKPDDPAGIRYAIEKVREYYTPEGRADFWVGAVRVYPEEELDHLAGFVHLNDALLTHVEQTYGVPKHAVLAAIEKRLGELGEHAT
jgi:membrane-bound lytic murein transglycosylase B